MVKADLAWSIIDDFTLNAGYTVFTGSEGTTFGQFADWEFAEISMEYAF